MTRRVEDCTLGGVSEEKSRGSNPGVGNEKSRGAYPGRGG